MLLISLTMLISFISLFIGLMMLIIESTLGFWVKVSLLSLLVLVYSLLLFKACSDG